MTESIYDIPVKTIDGADTTLETWKGKVLLIVNVASRCGFTGQYEGLESLYREYGPKGLVVLGFPCNQFGAQEPGDEAEIQSFCQTTYSVSFPMFAKIKVNGPEAHPLYQHLKVRKKGVLGTEGLKWNFTKFLVDRNGKVIDRFAPTVKPKDIAGEVEKALGSS
jgi:glutathione peroxidase